MDDNKVAITIYLDKELNQLLDTVALQQKRGPHVIIVESLRRYLHLKMFEILRHQSLPFGNNWVDHLKNRLKQIREEREAAFPAK
jgi:hypothetical protein